jgi:protein-disulfide isomerase-like protein with CxxC motif
MKEPEVINEIHRIRETHYQQTKDRNQHEVMREIEQSAIKFMKEYRMDLPIYNKSTEPTGVK